MSVEAVIFDWGGTLTPWHTFEVADIWRACARELDGLPEAEVEAVTRRLCAAELDVWRGTRTSSRSATLDMLFRAAGVTPGAAALEAMFTAMEPHTYTDPEGPPLLRALRDRGIRVGVLSNTLWPRELHDRVFTRDRILDLIDGAVYSSEIAWAKPRAEAFRAALDAVGVRDPRRAVFVGDRLYDDVHGASSVGMRTIFVPHSVLPPHQIVPVQATPDAVVRRLGEVLDVVERW